MGNSYQQTRRMSSWSGPIDSGALVVPANRHVFCGEISKASPEGRFLIVLFQSEWCLAKRWGDLWAIVRCSDTENAGVGVVPVRRHSTVASTAHQQTVTWPASTSTRPELLSRSLQASKKEDAFPVLRS
ncbi:hypothetical protein IHE44_0004798 [Lamprotornis superbus]|uniref:Uncharacterized protein n=1 Tax=Lamprotornis superbus TaxID=245042 RepID=A0A835ND21_9PASS|nr:hypothetical protein IHE44_0004798 [Lamprotornis superbus]